jgi:hypothetical protein
MKPSDLLPLQDKAHRIKLCFLDAPKFMPYQYNCRFGTNLGLDSLLLVEIL